MMTIAFETFLITTLTNVFSIAIKLIVALTLYASAKYNKFGGAILWGIFGFFFPLLASLVFYAVYHNKKKSELFCPINEPCYKKAMTRKR